MNQIWNRFRQWYINPPRMPVVRVSFLQTVLVSLLFAGVLIWVGFRWTMLSQDYADLHQEQMELREEITWLHLLEYQTKRYVRIYDATDFLSYGRLNPSQLQRVSDELWSLSADFRFDPLLILALVGVESQGDPNAEGRYRSGEGSGAYGLMQIKPGTAALVAREWNLEYDEGSDLFKPETNLILGTAYLMQLVNKYQSLRLGIMAYNIGPGALNARLKSRTPLPRRYYNRILSNYQALVRRFGPQPELDMLNSVQADSLPGL